jgi:hypothetical protein
MEFYISLNLKANQELNLGLDTEHLLLLTFLMEKQKVKQYQNESISENGNIYFWLSPKSVGNDLPILTNFCKTDRAKIDKIRGMYKNLIDLGVMEAYPKNQEIAKAYYTFTEKSSLLLTEKTVTPYENKRKPLTKINVSPYENNSKGLTEKTVTNSITNNSITNNSITISREEETPPTPQIENVNFNVIFSENENTHDPENKTNNLPLEEKKEKEKKVAAKKRKRTIDEVFADSQAFVFAWQAQYQGAQYKDIDPEKLYRRISNYCRDSGKVYADYIGRVMVWYDEAKDKTAYHFSKTPKQSENYIDKLFYDIQNADPNIV